MKQVFNFCALMTSVITVSPFANLSAQNTQKPNIVYIFPDQWRASAVGFEGKEPVKTPVIDKFVKESVVFTQAVSTYPVCIPYRGMLMTGKYPPSAGIASNEFEWNADISEQPDWISDVLKRNGYSVGYLGKWHISPTLGKYDKSVKGTARDFIPIDRRHGFDYLITHYGNNHMEATYFATNDKPGEAKKVGEWTPYFDTRNAIAFINNKNGERDKNKPFALFVSYNPPHMSYTTFPKELLNRYADVPDEAIARFPSVEASKQKSFASSTRNYYAMMSGVDEQIGLILKCLEEKGLKDNTIVVFTSDHGNCMGIHNEVSKNCHFEEAFRVPFIIRYPKKLKPSTTDLLLSTPDIAPTLLGFAGLKKQIPRQMEGSDFSDLLITGKGKKPSSQLYIHIDEGKPVDTGRRGVRTIRYTLVVDKDAKNAQSQHPAGILFTLDGNKQVYVTLHDRVNDPYQLQNIAGQNKALVMQLYKNDLVRWLKKIKDPWLNEFE